TRETSVTCRAISPHPTTASSTIRFSARLDSCSVRRVPDSDLENLAGWPTEGIFTEPRLHRTRTTPATHGAIRHVAFKRTSAAEAAAGDRGWTPGGAGA